MLSQVDFPLLAQAQATGHHNWHTGNRPESGGVVRDPQGQHPLTPLPGACVHCFSAPRNPSLWQRPGVLAGRDLRVRVNPPPH